MSSLISHRSRPLQALPPRPPFPLSPQRRLHRPPPLRPQLARFRAPPRLSWERLLKLRSRRSFLPSPRRHQRLRPQSQLILRRSFPPRQSRRLVVLHRQSRARRALRRRTILRQAPPHPFLLHQVHRQGIRRMLRPELVHRLQQYPHLMEQEEINRHQDKI